MADLQKTRNEPAEQLFEFLDGSHAVMVGLDQPGRGMQPMAPQIDEDRRGIWFFTKRDSELGGSVTAHPASRARLCLISPDHDYHAFVSGALSEETDKTLVDTFWSPVVAAWFDKGKQDPNLAMLRFDASEADIWASSGSAIRFAWEIAKANLDGDEPDLGEMQHVVFPVVQSSAR